MEAEASLITVVKHFCGLDEGLINKVYVNPLQKFDSLTACSDLLGLISTQRRVSITQKSVIMFVVKAYLLLKHKKP